MTTQNPAPAATKSRLRRIVSVGPHEVAALVASFAMFFALLSAYYIVRPVRDEIGVTLGKDALHQLFTVVFFAMIALVPLFGFIASRFPRRLVLPAICIFFASNLVIFWFAMKAAPDNLWAAGSFFVWASVFNLFVVSLFWSLMSELWSQEEAKRLFGFISAGGTAGRSRRTVADAGARQGHGASRLATRVGRPSARIDECGSYCTGSAAGKNQKRNGACRRWHP